MFDPRHEATHEDAFIAKLKANGTLGTGDTELDALRELAVRIGFGGGFRQGCRIGRHEGLTEARGRIQQAIFGPPPAGE